MPRGADLAFGEIKSGGHNEERLGRGCVNGKNLPFGGNQGPGDERRGIADQEVFSESVLSGTGDAPLSLTFHMSRPWETEPKGLVNRGGAPLYRRMIPPRACEFQ